MIDITCPQCKKVLSIPPQFGGQSGKCTHCGAAIKVPVWECAHPSTLVSTSRKKAPIVKSLLAMGAIALFAFALFFFITTESREYSLPREASRSDNTTGVQCDLFEILAELEGDTLTLRLETDLPDSADINVAAYRSYSEKGAPTSAYPIEYFSLKRKAADCREGITMVLSDDAFFKSLQKRVDELASIGMPFEVAGIADDIEVAFVLPIIQSNPAFGERNANLFGSKVPQSGVKAIRAERNIHKPVGPSYVSLPKATTASYDSLKVGSAYCVSRETPLMPEYEPADALSAITHVVSLPESTRISILEIRAKYGTPWYRARAYGREEVLLGEGWINSQTLIGQDISLCD